MSHSSEQHGHDHMAHANAAMLKWSLILTSLYLLAEVAGGLVFHSLALLSDAAHMLTDVAALVIALLAITLGQKGADEKRTFGYRRFEILAAAFNAVMLFAVAIYVFIEAVQRFKKPEAIGTNGMMLIAVIGLIVNVLSMRLLMRGKEHSFNVKGAYLEVWADMIGSIGVITGALVIRFTGWAWIDPVVAIGIGLWVLPRTWILLRDTTNVLLEGVPNGMNITEIRKAMSSVVDVMAVHDLHVWSMSNEEVSCTAHITLEPGADGSSARSAVSSLLEHRFGIQHATIQVESANEECAKAGSLHN